MNTVATMDEMEPGQNQHLGTQLANIRQQKGYTTEYVASKLHLRTQVIELIERSAFDLLPEAVFVKGYLRAYAKLLDIAPEPFLAVFNAQYNVEKKTERTLWQSTKKESYKSEHLIRWFTLACVLGVLVAVSLWWHNNRDTQPVFTKMKQEQAISSEELSLPEGPAKEIKLTDVSKLQALLNPNPSMSSVEKNDE